MLRAYSKLCAQGWLLVELGGHIGNQTLLAMTMQVLPLYVSVAS